jgi:uncharacterized paraquat-inducible protein A
LPQQEPRRLSCGCVAAEARCPHILERRRQYDAARRKRRKQLRLCKDCAAATAPHSTSRCPDCLAKQAERQAKKRQEQVDAP